MASRSRSTLLIGGTTHLAITPSTIKKMSSTKKKVPLGMRKLLCPPSSLPRGRQDAHAEVTHAATTRRPGVANTNSAMNARLMK